MNTLFSRRRFLVAAGSGLALPVLSSLALPQAARAEAAPLLLTAGRRSLEVGGKAASVFGITRADGGHGLVLEPGERFAVQLANDSGENTIIHWHGQTPPYGQDGVADHLHPALAPGRVASYDFIPRSGTHWMHSHHGLQEAQLMAAPLVVRTEADVRADVQEVILMLHDFSFRAPEELLAGLAGGAMSHGAMPGMGGGQMPMGGMSMQGMSMPGMSMPEAGSAMGSGMAGMAMEGMVMDLNDIDYDAYLANDRTLSDPQVVPVERGGRVRLRIINAASGTAFWVDFGSLVVTVLAVDGNAAEPVTGSRFPLSMAQRLDVMVEIPADAAEAFAVLALREGARERTGILLAPKGATVRKLALAGEEEMPALDLAFERQLRAADGGFAARPVDRKVPVMLMGGMAPYQWSVGPAAWPDATPFMVRQGERVELTFMNHTMMAHPMHLHGHHFQVVEIAGEALAGARRDTLLVPPMATAKVIFDADNPGRWPLHCHNLMHMQAGMMAELLYEGVA
ncbi:multicopper oxidase family protein [Radicibacter daui]|uniref:multicopper oxidase family protein n=1 Tax=Radicibacter daui TaxID=3064829 RepID=UPI0040469569